MAKVVPMAPGDECNEPPLLPKPQTLAPLDRYADLAAQVAGGASLKLRAAAPARGSLLKHNDTPAREHTTATALIKFADRVTTSISQPSRRPKSLFSSRPEFREVRSAPSGTRSGFPQESRAASTSPYPGPSSTSITTLRSPDLRPSSTEDPWPIISGSHLTSTCSSPGYLGRSSPFSRRPVSSKTAGKLQDLKQHQTAIDVFCEAELHGSLPQSLRCPRVTCILRPQPPWAATKLRWEICEQRPANSPSVRAYFAPAEPAVFHGREPAASFDTVPSEKEDVAASDSESSLSGTSDGEEPETKNSIKEVAQVEPKHAKVPRAELNMPWSEDELKSVFKKFAEGNDQELQIEDLPKVLRYLGERPNEGDIGRLIQGQTQYGLIEVDEFLAFMRRYWELDVHILWEMFSQADTDKNQELDFQELHMLLTKGGYSPTVDVTLEAMQTIDADGSGTVNFEEFHRLRAHLRSTHGFLKDEAEELYRLFLRVAGGPGKTVLPVSEVIRISAYLGYSTNEDDIDDVLNDIDKSSSSFLSYDDLLQLLRGIRELEHARINQLFVSWNYKRKRNRVDIAQSVAALQETFDRRTQKVTSFACPLRRSQLSSATVEQKALARRSIAEQWSLPVEQIQDVMSSLGYIVTDELVAEVIHEMEDEMDQIGYITSEEMISFTRIFRRVEGFTQAQRKDLMDIFHQEQRASVAGNCDDSLDALELGRVLRWFGISKPLQQVQRLIEQIDFDGSGQLEFDEFSKLMRQLFQEEAMQRRAVFRSLQSADGLLRASRIPQAFSIILDAPPDDAMFRIAKGKVGASEEDISFKRFEAIFNAYRAQLVEVVRRNAGYIPSEVAMFYAVFKSYDENGTGIVTGADLRMLIADNVPESTKTKAGQDAILRLLREVAPKGQKSLTFQQFLWFTRRLQDHRDEQDITQEAEVLKSISFSVEEVEDYRDVFSYAVAEDGELCYKDLKELLAQIHSFTERDHDELVGLVRDLNPFGEESLRFPQFLQLMHTLSKDNRLGLNDSAIRALRRQEYLASMLKA